MTRTFTRRQFLGRSAAAGALVAGFPVHSALAGAESKSPNEKLNIAAIGTTARGGANLAGVAGESVVALADVDENLMDKAAGRYPGARKYRDFRVLLEKEAERIDAVVVSTPDHTHAPAASMALQLGKHVYCEKPLTHTVYEARRLAELAQQKGLITQMGTQIHAGDNYRRVVELVQSGAIGPVRQVHVWCGTSYTGGRFTTDTPAPEHLDWDLWLGPAPERPYSEGVHPFHWRRFWDYGTGALGDLGCHYMDLAHWALNLRHPSSVSARGSGGDTITPADWVIADYQYPAREELPPVRLTWYDGGKRPEILGRLKDKDGQPLKFGNGQLFVGQHGMILSDYGRHVLLPQEKFAGFQPPEPFIPPSVGHHQEWIQAIKTGGTTTCNFDYSGALTEAVLLGTVAYRSGQPLDWDGPNLKITNAPEAQQLLHKEYRKGWTV